MQDACFYWGLGTEDWGLLFISAIFSKLSSCIVMT
jgi:hypothetical protein